MAGTSPNFYEWMTFHCHVWFLEGSHLIVAIEIHFLQILIIDMVTELGYNPTWLVPWCPAWNLQVHDVQVIACTMIQRWPRMAKDGQGFQMLEENDEKSWKTYEEFNWNSHSYQMDMKIEQYYNNI